MSLISRQLHLELVDARIPSSSQRYVVTEDEIRRIIAPERVLGLLVDELHIESILAEQHVSAVVQQAAKVLAILVCIGRSGSILDSFIYPGLLDAKLPLTESDLPPSLARFLDEQHHFLAPVLVSGLFADWGSETILPFFLDEPIEDARGGFSSVHKVGIIPQFQKLVAPSHLATPVYFARKELRMGRSAEARLAFRREKHTLDMLNLIRHSHIIPLLASYVHDDRFNMVFPLADANLAALLDGRYRFPAEGDNKLLGGILGITSALATVHHFRYTRADGIVLEKIGYHHDLKPDNILVRDGGLCLADFGLARLKSISEESATQNKHGTAAYGAPESQRQAPGLEFSRALDVWSWGCILLEILTFMLLGAGGVRDFRDRRRSESGMRIDYYFHDMVEIKQEVREWIEALKGEAVCQEHPHKDLLVNILGLTTTMLASNPRCRPLASSILRDLDVWYRREGLGEPSGQAEMCVRHEPVIAELEAEPETILENLAGVLDEEHPVIEAIRRAAGGHGIRQHESLLVLPN